MDQRQLLYQLVYIARLFLYKFSKLSYLFPSDFNFFAGLGGFVACRALSQRNNEPTKASRPWDSVMSCNSFPLVLTPWSSWSSEMHQFIWNRNANSRILLIVQLALSRCDQMSFVLRSDLRMSACFDVFT